jgi:hypothetical protein
LTKVLEQSTENSETNFYFVWNCPGRLIKAYQSDTKGSKKMSSIIWSYSALAAVPTEATIQKDLYVSRAGRLLFREGKSGIASFICPISDGSLEGEKGQHLRSLFLTYRDQDGPGPSPSGGPSEVHANLRRVRKSDGHVDTLPNSLARTIHEGGDAKALHVVGKC